MADSFRMDLTSGTDREAWLQRLEEATGHGRRSEAVMCAVRHYVRDKKNKQRVIADLDKKTVGKLSTDQLPLSYEIVTTVGKE